MFWSVLEFPLIGFRETSPSWVVKRTNGFVSKKPLGGMLLLLKFAPGVFVQVETVVHRYCIVRLATLSASFTWPLILLRLVIVVLSFTVLPVGLIVMYRLRRCV
jgi:hypothetical protein